MLVRSFTTVIICLYFVLFTAITTQRKIKYLQHTVFLFGFCKKSECYKVKKKKYRYRPTRSSTHKIRQNLLIILNHIKKIKTFAMHHVVMHKALRSTAQINKLYNA